MVDRLRLFLNRPLRDSDRPRLFALAVALIALAAALLAGLDDRSSTRVRRTAARPPAAIGLPAAIPSAEPTVASSAPPSEEGAPSAALRASAADVAGAKRAARRFLAGYVPYSYGHGGARRIAAAAAGLRRRLVREHPHVPAAERRRHPRLVLVQAAGVSRARGSVVAVVDDGARRYSLTLALAHKRARWRVTAVGA